MPFDPTMKIVFQKMALNLMLLFVLSQALLAQIDESDTMKLQLQLALTGNYQRGNAELLTVLSRNEALIRPFDHWAFKTQINSLYTEFFDRRIDNNIFSRNALYYKPENRVYGYVTAFLSTNFRRKIRFRYFITAGPTLQAIRREDLVLKLSVNVVRERTLFSDTVFNEPSYNGSDRISLWRSTLYIGGWAFALNKRLRMNYEFYWQPAYNDRENYRTQLEIGFSYPIWKGLGFNVVYIFSHENLVVEGIKQDDRILTFGLNFLLSKNGKKVHQ